MLMIGLVALLVIGACIKIFDDKIRHNPILKRCVVYGFYGCVLFIVIGIIQLII